VGLYFENKTCLHSKLAIRLTYTDMRKVASLIFFLTTIGISQVAAQDYKKIEKLIEKKYYLNAWKEIEKELPVQSDDKTLNFYAGVAKLGLYRQKESLDFLLKSDASVDKKYNYFLARAYFENDNLPEAKRIAKKIDLDKMSREEAYLISNQFVSYEELRKSPGHVVVKNLGENINSSAHEYNGVMTKDQRSVLFTVRKQGEEKIADDGLPYEEIYKTTIDSTDNWQKPEKFSSYSTKNHHDASVAIFDNDSKMITYHDDDLFISELVDGAWTDPVPLNQINSDGGSETHCFITPGFDTIFYATDYYSANGDLDLYMTIKSDEEWSEPIALDELNSPLNDDSPYLTENGDFYFSSQGHNSIGGYDIFRSELKADGRWEKPQNMGYKINSSSDDIYFNSFGKIAYLSSGRKGGFGNMDIYRVFLFDKVNITGQVIDDKINKAIAGAKISVKGDETTEVYSDDNGQYTIEVPIEKVFDLSIEFENQLIYNEKHFANVLFRNYNDNVVHLEVDISGELDNIDNEPKRIAVKMVNDYKLNPVEIAAAEEIKEYLTLEVITPKKVKVDNPEATPIATDNTLPIVYFDFNKTELDKEYRIKLIKLAQQLHRNTDMSIEIVGHTDLPGTVNYNKELGMERAFEIREYLFQLGIPLSRVVITSEGESAPVVKTVARNLKNRRAELKYINLGEEPMTRFADN
ncbi:MAG: OmpA family protein, partial [Cyclobacteriaceae bacterium]